MCFRVRCGSCIALYKWYVRAPLAMAVMVLVRETSGSFLDPYRHQSTAGFLVSKRTLTKQPYTNPRRQASSVGRHLGGTDPTSPPRAPPPTSQTPPPHFDDFLLAPCEATTAILRAVITKKRAAICCSISVCLSSAWSSICKEERYVFHC